MASGSLRRRSLLLLAAGAVVVPACARWPSQARQRPITLGSLGGPFGSVPGLAAAFRAAHPAISFAEGHWVIQGGHQEPVFAAHVRLVFVPEADVGLQYAAPPPGFERLELDSVLRLANANLTQLPPGVRTAGSVGGHRTTLIWSQNPLAVAWRPDVFASAHLGAPDASWTWADFEATVAALQAFAQGLKMPSLAAALPPGLTFYTALQGAPPSAMESFVAAQLQRPLLWMAFVLGFGGSVNSGGRFQFDAGAMAGLDAYVSFARRWAPLAPLPASASPDQYALTVQAWPPPSIGSGAPWAYARLPLFPLRPVITTRLQGVGLWTVRGAVPTEDELNAAADALVWLYSEEAQRLIADSGNVPVVDSAALEDQVWRHVPAADASVGDWRNFAPWLDGWPGPTPYPLELSMAVEGRADIGDVVSTFEAKSNAWLQQQGPA